MKPDDRFVVIIPWTNERVIETIQPFHRHGEPQYRTRPEVLEWLVGHVGPQMAPWEEDPHDLKAQWTWYESTRQATIRKPHRGCSFKIVSTQREFNFAVGAHAMLFKLAWA